MGLGLGYRNMCSYGEKKPHPGYHDGTPVGKGMDNLIENWCCTGVIYEQEDVYPFEKCKCIYIHIHTQSVHSMASTIMAA